jgi:hypothetical protein
MSWSRSSVFRGKPTARSERFEHKFNPADDRYTKLGRKTQFQRSADFDFSKLFYHPAHPAARGLHNIEVFQDLFSLKANAENAPAGLYVAGLGEKQSHGVRQHIVRIVSVVLLGQELD